MSVENQFKAAVEIIRSLPKNGSFQPPYTMQLTFYSYYKQATEGPCRGSRPAFWDVVGRAKYDAWSGLGSMPKEEAMAKYVDEFVSTIKRLQSQATPEEVKEALSYAEPKHIALFRPLFADVTKLDNVPPELRSLANGNKDALDERPDDGIEKIEGDRDTDGEEYSDTFNHLDEEQRASLEQAEIINGRAVIYQNMKNNNNIIKTGGGDPNSCPPPPMAPYMGSNREPFAGRIGAGWPAGDGLGAAAPPAGGSSSAGGASGAANGDRGNGRRRRQRPNNNGSSDDDDDKERDRALQAIDNNNGSNSSINLSYAVMRLQTTMDEIVRRLDRLEGALHGRRASPASRWTLLGGLQPHVIVTILGWPLLVQFIIYLVRRRRLRVQLRLK